MCFGGALSMFVIEKKSQQKANSRHTQIAPCLGLPKHQSRQTVLAGGDVMLLGMLQLSQRLRLLDMLSKPLLSLLCSSCKHGRTHKHPPVRCSRCPPLCMPLPHSPPPLRIAPTQQLQPMHRTQRGPLCPLSAPRVLPFAPTSAAANSRSCNCITPRCCHRPSPLHRTLIHARLLLRSLPPLRRCHQQRTPPGCLPLHRHRAHRSLLPHLHRHHHHRRRSRQRDHSPSSLAR